MLSMWHHHIHSVYLIYLGSTKSTPIHTAFRYSWIPITNRMNDLFHCGYSRVLSIYVGLYEYLRVLRVFACIACIRGYLSISAGIFVVRVEASECLVMTAGVTSSTSISISIYLQGPGIWVLANDCRCNYIHIYNYVLSESWHLRARCLP